MNAINSAYSKNQRACRHPCFNNFDFHNAVIHLPIASVNNMSGSYGAPSEPCMESTGADIRGGLLTPYEALERFLDAKKSIPNLTVAAIAGPGEPLADFDALRETFKLLRQASPDTILCLSTNGLMLPVYANHLISLGVNYITVTVNTISPDTGAGIYGEISYLGRKYSGVEGANILLQNQISGISYLAAHGISVRVNIEVLAGINEEEIRDIVRMAGECGCRLTNILQRSHSMEGEHNGPEAYGSGRISSLRRECESILPQSYYCKPCNAATVETLNTRLSIEPGYFRQDRNGQEKPESISYRFAVCSKTGKLIDQHFGHATKFYIFDYRENQITFVETRPIEQYCSGSREEKAAGRIYKLIKTIEDCNCVICMRIGICPSNALKEKNIDIYTTYNLVEEGLKEAVYRLYTYPSADML